MALARYIPIFTETTGLNNAVDPVRLKFDMKTGVTELARAVNVDIDDTGRITRRRGYTRKSTTAGSSAFADGERCYFVSGAILYQLHPDYSMTAVRSDLTVGQRMSFWPIADRVYYTNGIERGYIAKGKDNVWEAGDYNGVKTNRTFYDPPAGHLVSWFAGRALVARGNFIFGSEVSQYGRFDIAKVFHAEADRITMVRPTTNGVLVGTTHKVIFWRGQEFLKLKREVLYDSGVLEGSDAWCSPDSIGGDATANWEGRSHIFTTPSGVCAVSDNGDFVNLTSDKLIFPSARYASGSVIDDKYLVLIQP